MSDDSKPKSALEQLAELDAQADAKRTAEADAKAEAAAVVELSNRKRMAELSEEYGADNLSRCDTAAGMVVIRTPKESEFERFKAMLEQKNEKQKATKALTSWIVVHPSKEGYSDMLRRKPGVAEVVGNKAVELAGFIAEESAKK